MKKRSCEVMGTAVLAALLALARPSTAAAGSGPPAKLFRGTVNIVTAPLEIPRQARAYWIEGAQKTDHILVWIFSGTVKGMVEMVKRTGSGVWDVVTFPLAVPEKYAPLVEPEYPWQEWPQREGNRGYVVKTP